VIGALLTWHRRHRPSALPREHLLGAMRAGMRFARYTPTMRAAMIRSAVFFGPGAAPWAMLPLIVKQQLGLGAGVYGLMLGLMGAGGVTSGLLLPQLRNHLSRGNIVFFATLSSCSGMIMLGLTRHWAPAAVGMVLFGLGWVAASSVAQGAAQLSAPAWVRSRALAIYQLASNGAMIFGTFFWGWLATQIGLSTALLAAAGTGLLLAIPARSFDLDAEPVPRSPAAPAPPAPEAVAPELVSVVAADRARVMESQHYRIDPARQPEFLSVMAEVRDARGRAGAADWQLYEDVAHPDGWLEVWSVETWTDHLRVAMRMSEADRAVIARAMAFHLDDPTAPQRYLAVAPHRLTYPTPAPGGAVRLSPRPA